MEMAAPLRKITTSCYPKSIRNANIPTVTSIITQHHHHHGRQRRHFHHFASWNNGNHHHHHHHHHHHGLVTPRRRIVAAHCGGSGVIDSIIDIRAHDAANHHHHCGFVNKQHIHVSYFSSSSSTSSSSSSSSSSSLSSSSSNPSKSFKKVIRPFLMACHPDSMSAETTNADDKPRRHPLSHRSKAVNLTAVQTINGLIDILDDLIGRCTPPSYSTSHSNKRDSLSAVTLPELKPKYEIEFILPSSSSTMLDGDKPVKRRHRDRESQLTLRSITVSFPKRLRDDAKRWALTSFPANNYPDDSPHPREEDAFRVAVQLRDHALGELLRLLAIAGMQAPASSVDEMKSRQRRQHRQGRDRPRPKTENEWTLSDHFLHELGLDPNAEEINADPTPMKPAGQSLAFFGRTQARPSRDAPSRPDKAPPPQYKHPHMQRQRAAFMNSIPWNKFATDYDQAFLDAQANWTTTQLKLYDANTAEGRERREEFASRVCGKVRIWRQSVDGGGTTGSGNNSDDDDEEGDIMLDEIPEGLDVVAQLVAIRRLSIILVDNFDHLRMENMGRMWERLVIVLTPPRIRGPKEQRKETDRPLFKRQGMRKKLNKWERRMKRRDKREPMSRGRMRYLAETLLGPQNNEDTEDDADEDTNEEEMKKQPLLPESGFKFSYGTNADQGTGHVKAYVPVDFREGELVGQLYTHLYDYFDNCCGNVGFLKYGADGEITATVGVEDVTNNGGGGSGRGGGDGDEDDDGNDEEKDEGLSEKKMDME